MKQLIYDMVEAIEKKYFKVDNYNKFLRYNEFIYADPAEIKYFLNPNGDPRVDKAIDEALNYMSIQFHMSNFKGIHDGSRYINLPHHKNQIKNIHPSATNIEIIYRYFNGYPLYENDFEIGQEIKPGDGSFMTSDNIFDNHTDRYNENNPVLPVVSKPYWALVFFPYIDKEKKKMYRFVDVISSETGITYRVLAFDSDESVFNSHRTPIETFWDDIDDYYDPNEDVDFFYE